MSRVATEVLAEQDKTEGLLLIPLRWGTCFTLMLGLHLGAAWLALHWMQQIKPAPPSSPPAAVMIDFAPWPMTQTTPPTDVAPDPKQTLSQPQTSSTAEIQQPLPEALPSPMPEVAVPVPEEPKTRPVQRHRRVEHRRPRRIPDKTPPAAASAAPQPLEAPLAPSTAAPMSGFISTSPLNAVPTWQALLLNRLEQFKRYPYDAQLRHQEGVVTLRFAMDRHGNVVSASIEKGSGFVALDQEALALVRRAAPLPPPPVTIPGDPIELVAPVQFSLH